MKGLLMLLFMSLSCFAQQKLKTDKYAGVYRYEDSRVEAAGGQIIIYPETDTTVLYYIEVSRGAPSYNSGAIYGRLTIIKGKAVADKCKLEFVFSKKSITISSPGLQESCDYFGYGVIADGAYQRTSHKAPDFFIDREGKKNQFKEVTPQEYNK